MFKIFAAVLALVLSQSAFAISDAELESAGRAQDRAYQRKWNDEWLSIVAGAAKAEMSIKIEHYCGLKVVDVKLVGFRKLDDAFASSRKKMRMTLEDGSQCLRYAQKCGGKTYGWKTYCAKPDKTYLFEDLEC